LKIEVLMVANAAGVENGLLSVGGAGWEHYVVQLFPSTIRGSVAGIITLDAHDIGELREMQLTIDDAGGHIQPLHAAIVVSGVRPAPTADGVPARVPFDIPFATVASAPTTVRVSLTYEGAVISTTTFAVHDPIPDSPTGP
jgi:hypothetical protein